MVSISLRAYINEINDLVDEHQIDEAIAHCRHILEQYPKHVDTYRLLGKAYLEEQRYGDAADIMQRVLSSVPEDFIAQVGMSIIREDEGNLDSAIYHMERAFETQPSNHAIQNELRRLNSKRDGIELTRVRLTRGALARMYAHGHLYDQAISELQVALSENPNRFDLQNLLAEMYYQTEKMVDAAETCTKIIEKLPHCLNANKLLTQILEESGRPEEAKRYRQRWIALDPYAKFVGEEFPLIDTVPDNHVSLEHLEWDPSSLYGAEDEQPAWATSLGLSLSDEDSKAGEPMPDWLEGAAAEELDDLKPTEMLSSDEADPLFSDEPAVLDGNRIGLMPQAESGEEDREDDWLSDFGESASGAEPTGEEADWLATLDTTELNASEEAKPSPFRSDADDETDDWLASIETPSEEPEPSGEDIFAEEDEDDTDDWLASLETPSDELPPVGEEIYPAEKDQDDTDDWLASLDTSSEEEEQAGEDVFAIDAQEDDDDGWLAALEEKSSDMLPTEQGTPSADPDAELPDFLKEAGWQPGSDTLDESALREPEEELAEAEIPDWIKEMAPAEVEEEGDDLSAEVDPEWMKSLEAPASSPADWLQELEAETPAQEPDEEPELPMDEIAAGQEIEADDAGMAWLENLAAKQGIPDEEMTTTPEQRAEVTEEDLPVGIAGLDLGLPDTLEYQLEQDQQEPADTDWLQQIGQDKETDQEKEPKETVDEPSAWLETFQQDETSMPEGEADDTISRFLAAKAVLGEDADLESPTQEVPEEEDRASETPNEKPAEPVSPVDEEADDFDMDWLDTISTEAAEEAADEGTTPYEDKLPEDEEPMEETLEPVSPVDEEADSLDSDWLDAIGAEAAEEATAEDEWMADISQEAEADEDEPSPDWLKTIGQEADDETVEPVEETSKPVSPVDEEADSFDSAWLDAIGAEAAEEAAEDEPPAEEDWLSDVTEAIEAEEDEPSTDWLKQISQGAEEETIGTPDETPEPAPPVDEEAENFDEDWLAGIGTEDSLEEVEEEIPPVGETPAEQEWLPGQETAASDETLEPVSPVDEEKDDFDLDWLDKISTEAAEQAAGEESVSPVDEEMDDFDMDWLDEIGAEAAQEAAEEELTPLEEELATQDRAEGIAEEPVTETTEPISPEDEEKDKFDEGRLEADDTEPSQETEEEESAAVEEIPAEDGWLERIEQEDDRQRNTLADTDAWLLSMEEESVEGAEQPEAEVTDSDEWLSSIGIPPAEDQIEAEPTPPPVTELPEVEPEDAKVAETVQPTQAEEWQPESDIEPDAEPEPDPLAGQLETAKQYLRENNLGEALKSYGKIIKKGKLVEEVIQDLTEATTRHPINVKLWQVLGDAYLRIDRLQDALDAYSKAEELLR